MTQNLPTHSSKFLRGEIRSLRDTLLSVGKVECTLNLFRNPLGFLGCPREKQDVVSACLEAEVGPADAFRKALRLHTRGADSDDEIRIAARLNRIANLFNHLLDRNRFRPAVHIVVETLRTDLIVNTKTGSSSVLEHTNRMENVSGLAESAAGVDEKRDIYCTRDPLGGVRQIVQAKGGFNLAANDA